jgi:hypothetical protein
MQALSVSSGLFSSGSVPIPLTCNCCNYMQ